jgi:hypothetical protein
MSKLEQALTQQAQAQTQMMQAITLLAQSQASKNTDPNKGSNNSESSPPSSPTSPPSKTPLAAPAAPSASATALPQPTLPEITPINPYKAELKLDNIVTADLEALINQGNNEVFMVAWYNGKESKIFDITSFQHNTHEMLKAFWFDLINNNKGATVYLHNWAGYDSILALQPLF